MKKEIPNPYQDKRCFYCGSENPEGLKLHFYRDDETEEVSTEYFPAQHFIGQGNILHGGIQLGLLDEIMGWTSYVYTGEMAVTSDFKAKFIMPVYLDKTVKAVCKVTSREDLKVHMHAALKNDEGLVCTTATGVYHILSPDKYQALINGK